MSTRTSSKTDRSGSKIPNKLGTPCSVMPLELSQGLLNYSNSWPFHQHVSARDPPEENNGGLNTYPEIRRGKAGPARREAAQAWTGGIFYPSLSGGWNGNPGKEWSWEALLDRRANALIRSGKEKLLGNIQERAENLVLNSGAGNICFNEIHGLQL